MNPTPRPRIGILTGDPARADSLREWLTAAGFTPERVDDVRGPAAAFVVVSAPLADLDGATAPIVLLVERSAEPPAAAAARAAHVVPLPDAADVQSLLSWSTSLMHVLQQIAKPRPATGPSPAIALAPRELEQPVPQVIAVGVSTGGPEALGVLFRSLSGYTLPPIAIVQHIPAKFLPQLVERLSHETGYAMRVAQHGTRLETGIAYFAPGDRHMRLLRRDDGTLVSHLTDEEPVRGHRPAAEILFESCATLPIRGLGVVMTGMGRDGAAALLRLRQCGWATMGQNEASCAIYGMPMAAKELGAIEREVALQDLGRWTVMLCRARRVPVAR